MINQLAFGYDEGHRLLTGSVMLSATSTTMLLGATDAAPGSIDDRLITGIPLETEELYAFCLTWSAPEVSRPGAVWAHVLLLDLPHMRSMENPFGLVMLARRPERATLEQYAKPMPEPAPNMLTKHPPIEVLEGVISAAYDVEGSHVVVTPNLSWGESALALIWQAQWPELRMRFSFRTRDAVKGEPKADVVVARRIRGSRRAREGAVKRAWVTGLAKDLVEDGPSQLSDLMNEFGPLDVPEPATVAALARISGFLELRDANAAREEVERRYPSRSSGVALKSAVFGSSRKRWWSATERACVGALLATRIDAWDPEQLDLSNRLARLVKSMGVSLVAENLSDTPVPIVRDAVLEALVEAVRAKDVAELLTGHQDLAAQLLERRPDLPTQAAMWRDLDQQTALGLLGELTPLSDAVIQGAAEGGQVQALVDVLGKAGLVKRMVRSGSIQFASKVLSPRSVWRSFLDGSTNDRAVLLAAALYGTQRASGNLLRALTSTRTEPDDLWFRAAIAALPATNVGDVLPVVFGPLHSAITEGRLQRESWSALDRLLPPGNDLARRLRKYLLDVARSDVWPTQKLATVLRDAGVDLRQLRKEYRTNDEWWDATAKALKKALGPK